MILGPAHRMPVARLVRESPRWPGDEAKEMGQRALSETGELGGTELELDPKAGGLCVRLFCVCGTGG